MNLQEAVQLVKSGGAQAIIALPEEVKAALRAEVQPWLAEQQKQHALQLYRPVSEHAEQIHYSTAKEVLTVGGNRSSKSDTHLAEAVIQMTGIVPESLKDRYPKEKLRAPIRVRLVCNSLTSVWEPVLKPKLQWDQWNGRGLPGSGWGHFGWIPPSLLVKGSWQESWSEKYRTLTLTNGSTLQVGSYDPDVESFAGGSYHLILHDEGPRKAIYRENLMRTMDVGGRMMTAMTPPDDESAAWDAAWIFDDLYEKGVEGTSSEINVFELDTYDNQYLDRKEIDKIYAVLTPRQRLVRFKGRFIHLTGLIYPIWSPRPADWCFTCNDIVLVVEGRCSTCNNMGTARFCHLVDPFEMAYQWPCVFLIDPHPRKPHMMSWVAVSPSDDYYQVAELEVDGTPEEVKKAVDGVERGYNLKVIKRGMDPNMGGSPAHSAGRRQVTVRDEFDTVGLRCDMMDNAFTVGKSRLTALFQPDRRTLSPRLRIFSTCKRTAYQMSRYTWSEWTRYSTEDKDPKPQPKAKNDDFPTLFESRRAEI
jgi:hypothetical protein